MKIIQNLVPESKYSVKAPYPMTPVGICVHNTANDASAKNEISYMVSNDLTTSFHFAVDDKEIWQGIPVDRNAWHAGDGTNGEGNRRYIGVEICYSKSGGERFKKAERLAAEFIANLLEERGWGLERVKKHQDFSGKNCPHRTLEMGWERFLRIVESHLDSMGGTGKMPPKVEITDQTKLPLNFVTELERYTELEFGTLKSKIKDKDRAIFNNDGYIKTLETNFNISEANFANLSRQFDKQKDELFNLGEENEELREEVKKLKEGVLKKPLFRIGRFAIYFTRP